MPNIEFTSAQINHRLNLIAENKNLLEYPYKSTLPSGLTNVGDGAILTSSVYSSQQGVVITAHELPAGTYIASLAITDIKENPTLVSGFILKVTVDGTTYATNATSNDKKKLFVQFTLAKASGVEVSLDIPDNAIIGLLIKPQIEKVTSDRQPSDWVPNMDQIGTYVDRRFNGTNAKVKILDDKIDTTKNTLDVKIDTTKNTLVEDYRLSDLLSLLACIEIEEIED